MVEQRIKACPQESSEHINGERRMQLVAGDRTMPHEISKQLCDREGHEKERDDDTGCEYQPIAGREIGLLQAEQRDREDGGCEQPLARPADGVDDRQNDG